MKIALIGYGKMGHMIEDLALPRGHEIVLKIDETNIDQFTAEALRSADVAIEFTGPESAFDNVHRCLEWGVPVVSGSTGWNSRLGEMKAYCEEQNGSFLHASNFSIGVNIFFEVNKLLARLMAPHAEYEVHMKEIHHTQKKDAPSGTAVTLAEQVLAEIGRKKEWVNDTTTDPTQLAILSERIDPAPGTHEVTYTSAIDNIQIIHTAHSRKGFALGALLAAEYIHDKKGVFTIGQVLGLGNTK